MPVPAEIFEHWRLRVGIPDFDEDSRVVARQLQAYGRLVVVPAVALTALVTSSETSSSVFAAKPFNPHSHTSCLA